MTDKSNIVVLVYSIIYLIQKNIFLFTYFLPANIFSNVDFPAPEGPRMNVSFPGRRAPQALFKIIWSSMFFFFFLIHAFPKIIMTV